MSDAPRGRLWTAVVFAVCFALYRITFPLDSDGIILGSDVTWYARDLAAGDHWHPHHLLFHLVAAALIRFAGPLLSDAGPVYAALDAQRLLGVIGGAGMVALLFRFAARRIGTARAVGIAGVFAFATGIWFYAAVGEAQTPALFPLVALLFLAAEERLDGRRRAFALHLGLLLLAVLVRQDSILVVPAYLVLMGDRRGVGVVATAGVISLGLYAWAWTLSPTRLEFTAWLFRLASDGSWNPNPFFISLRDAVVGTFAALVYVASLTAVNPLGLMVVALVISAVLLGRATLGPAERRVVLGLSVFAVTRFGFYAWWQPTNPEYHGITWLPLLAIGAMLLRRRSEPGDRCAAIQSALLGAAALLTLFGTARATILPHRSDATARRAREAIERAGPGGCVLALDWVQDWALMREAPRDVVVLRATQERMEDAHAALGEALAGGGRVLLIRDDILGPRILGDAAPLPSPALLAEVLGGRRSNVLEADQAGIAWLVEVLPR